MRVGLSSIGSRVRFGPQTLSVGVKLVNEDPAIPCHPIAMRLTLERRCKLSHRFVLLVTAGAVDCRGIYSRLDTACAGRSW